MTLDDLAAWDKALGLRRSTVLFVTLWMTWRAFAWAAQYAAGIAPADGVGGAAMIAAVTAPISALQIAVFKAYLDSKSDS